MCLVVVPYSVITLTSFLALQVEIKRTIPRGSMSSNDFKTKKIFVGGIPSSVEDGKTLSYIILYIQFLLLCLSMELLI